MQSKDGTSHTAMNSANMPAMSLVQLSDVTHTAVSSGDWSDPATWSNNQVPTNWAKVHIPEGIEVRVDGVINTDLKTVRVDGTLSFKNDVNTELNVDTLVTTMTGHLVIGTANAPIANDVTAKIIFADDGAIDKSWDPNLLSRGALLHGKTTIYGEEKLAFAAVAEFPKQGDTSVTLKEAPTGWEVGDIIVIAGTDPKNPESDEKVQITSIDGNVVGFDTPLALDHVAPLSDLEVHVANLTRNILFTSENADLAHRGHVMIMHTNDADINFAAFDDLGRTDKSQPLNDHQFVDLDPNIAPIDLGGDNVRGRYSLHFHKGGTDKNGEAGKVNGSVVTDDPGWAYVNHSSHVDFTNNVSHNIVGAAYNTEAGDEIGSFIGNIAIRTVNKNDPLAGGEELDPDAREHLQDYGFQGDGFWFHGPNVRVEDNVVSGASGHAYIWWPEGLLEKTPDGTTQKVFHNSANVPNGNLIGPDGTNMEIWDVPIGSFIGNEGYSATKGIQIFYLHTNFFGEDVHAEDGIPVPPDSYFSQLRSTIQDATIWNVEQVAFAAPYVNRITIDNIRLVGKGGIGLDLGHFMNDQGIIVNNATIEGFGVGIRQTTDGQVTINGGTFANRTDIQKVNPGADGDRMDGTNGADVMFGAVGDDTIAAGDGDDTIRATAGDTGNDKFAGGKGDDVIGGGVGDDVLIGGNAAFSGGGDVDAPSGSDTLFGGDGADRLVGSNWQDKSDGRVNNGDTFGNNPKDGGNLIWGGTGDDFIMGGGGADTMGGGLDDDTMRGQGGDDLIYSGKTGRELIEAGDGNDTVFGSAGNDTIRGDGGNDQLFGGSERDSVAGGSGNDSLYGGSDRDTLDGGTGDDILNGGTGDDTLTGGAGRDVFVFSNGSGSDVITDFADGEDLLNLSQLNVTLDAISITQSNGNTLVSWDGGSVLLQGFTATVDQSDLIL